ncbi:N-6 DNA methylase [uncultured Ruminococcus sp.]|uniref:N-6 DNA methylase n=1 Tax=uncultured Ruminococcus sp. TaxID=165186 RepID=UPI00266B8940|nr:N-6 DNA methylase [uncultured Ruminococcus sp.]
MELLEFKTKILKLCNVRDIKNIGEVLMKVVLSNETCFFDKYKEIIDNNKDWLQALWQYYEADRTEKKQDYTPKSLCKLVSALAGDCKTIYDCCAGSGALTLQNLKDKAISNLYIEELDENVIPFLLFNLSLHNANGYVVNGDVLKQEKYKIYKLSSGEKYSTVKTVNTVPNFKADVAVSNPPYNIKWQPPLSLENDIRFPVIPPAGNANYAFVFNCIARANKAVLILPLGALTQRNEYDIRKYLIDNDLIESIITLPNNMFECTSISTCIMVLNKNKANKGKVNLIHSIQNFVVEEREQNGQFGGKSHTNRTYKKKYNVLSDENINKIIQVIENLTEVNEFSLIKSNAEIAEKKYMLAPSMFFDVSIEDFEDSKHRDLQEIANNINYIIKMQNACKLVINETIAKKMGFDIQLYKNEFKNSNQLADEQSKLLGIKIEKSDYIQFTKNKNEFMFKCNDRELLPDIFIHFLTIWKNQIALLNTMQNQYLSELRDAILPDLMNGKIEL